METGLTHTSEMTVEEHHLAVNVGSGDLPVLGTPVMMTLMENAAMLAVGNHLPEGSSTVGSEIASTHIRPTALGQKVRATAVLTAIDGRKLSFDIKAEDDNGIIGEGHHTRFIVDKERFMKKITILCFVLLCMVLSTKAGEPLRISILGDSYSTFEGYITPATNEPWYFLPDSPGKCKDNDVERVEQTWWHQLIERMGAKLELNNSYSGSPIGYTGYVERPGNGHANYKPRSFITRAPNLGNPDLILVCAATNDSWDGEQLGIWKYSDWQEHDLYTFRPAMAKFCHEMKRLYPTTRIVFILNSELKEDFTDAIHVILKHYGIECLDLHDIDKQAGHPSVKGMKAFADQVYHYLCK